MSESKDYEKEEKYEVIRVTSLKSNGIIFQTALPPPLLNASAFCIILS